MLSAPLQRRFCLAALLCAASLGWPNARAETLTLADCLREVVEHNPTVQEQRADIEQATATKLVLRARSLPNLTAGGILGVLNQEDNVPRSRTEIPAASPGGSPTIVRTRARVETTEQFIALATGNLTQPLFDAAIPASYRRGTVGVLAAKQNFYTIASAQLHAARLLFYQALYQQQSGEILRQNDAVLASGVQTLDRLVTAGLVGRAPLLSAQVQRTNFAPIINAAGGTYRTSLDALLQTMGRRLPPGQNGDDPLAHITLAGELEETAPTFDAAEATRTALARRPDLQALRAMVKVQQEEANIAKAGYYPLIRLYLAGEYVPESNVRNRPNAIRQSDQVQTSELRPGISGNWVVIDPGTTRGAVRGEEAQRDVVAIGLRRLETNLPAEIAVVRARLSDATAHLNALRGSDETAQSTLNIIQGGLAQGVNTQTEFLYAQSDLLNLRTNLLAARYELTTAHAELDRVTGNYLRYVEETPGPPDRHNHRK